MKDFKEKFILFNAVGRLWFALKRWGRQYLSDLKYDLTMEQLIVLSILDAAEDGLPIKVLAELVERERTTISRMIDGLEKRNLVLRVNDKRDNRQKLVYLTHLAREKLKEIISLEKILKDTAFAKIDMVDVLRTEEILHKIADNLVGKETGHFFLDVATPGADTSNSESKQIEMKKEGR